MKLKSIDGLETLVMIVGLGLRLYHHIRGNNVELALGPEAKASLKFEGGKAVLAVVYEGVQASANLSVSLDAEQFGKMLKDAIPGKIDDAIIDVLIAAAKVSV